MKFKGLWALAIQDLNASRLRSMISAAGIALGVAVLLMIVGLGLGARQVILQEVVRSLPSDTIEVIPHTVDLGLFQLDAGGILGGRALDEVTVKRVQKMPEVGAVFPKLEVALPLGARGGGRFFGKSLYSDLFINALPEALLKPSIGDSFSDQHEYIPMVISDQLIEVYNTSFASSIGAPKLTADALIGFEFELVVGRSMILGRRGARRTGVERARIVGVSPLAMRLGATIPLKVGRRLFKDYGIQNDDPETYSSILVRAKTPDKVPAIIKAIEEMGLKVDSTAERTANILTLATLLGTLVALLVLTLAALNIAHSFFASLSERRRELAILRAVGARRRDIVSLVLLEANIVGLLGGIMGALIALFLSYTIDFAATHWMPDFPFKPDSFFVMPWWLLIASLLAAALASCAGALWPALRAARAPLARALGDS
ncbi:ABC transporter permease [Myxococcota bacterium]|nr:ABC transporter permease [Myxococcota bacterium]